MVVGHGNAQIKVNRMAVFVVKLAAIKAAFVQLAACAVGRKKVNLRPAEQSARCAVHRETQARNRAVACNPCR